MKNGKNIENYYVGLDIGTNSVGYAVADENYELCKFKGEPMWGVTLFDEAETKAERRGFRTSRRRLDRRQQRVHLVQELFAKEIAKVDENFFKRIHESYLYSDTEKDKIHLFGTREQQKNYAQKYPTIHHLIVDLIKNDEPHDVRLVYLACAWLVAHRGHFLSEVDVKHIDQLTDFKIVYNELKNFIERDGEYSLPWRSDIELNEIAEILKSKKGVRYKEKELTKCLFDSGKAPEVINEQYRYNYKCVINLLCGGTTELNKLFGKEEYGELEEKSIKLNADDEKLTKIMQAIGDDFELISVLKKVYDWSVLVDILNGKSTISEAKVAIYEQHKEDLKTLKHFAAKYLTKDKFKEIFCSEKEASNYVTYIGKNKSTKPGKSKDSTNREDFCKYIKKTLEPIKNSVSSDDISDYNDMLARLEANSFMPKQVDSDNRVIPYQLYWFEMNALLEKAENYLPFLSEADSDGTTVRQKLISVFEFRVPYYVGPLNGGWMVRRAKGTIYPWNFNDMVDLDESENEFIRRMTNSCTYIPGEDVLPKCSLLYCSFEVLNEINNIKIDGKEIPVSVKQEIYNNLFMTKKKVTPKSIKDHLTSNGHIEKINRLDGLGETVKSSLVPYIQFKKLLEGGVLDKSAVERIINQSTYTEEKSRLSNWLEKNYPNLSENDRKYISSLKFKDFGRLSKRFLTEINGVNTTTGEAYTSIIRAMWETNYNLMQLMSDKFTFKDNLEKLVRELYGTEDKSLSQRIEELPVPSSVKRPIIRSLDILKDIKKVQGNKDPKRIFIEMARGEDKEHPKGKPTTTRLKQLQDLYDKIDCEETRKLSQQLDEWGDEAHGRLQSDRIFLYFIQLGKCLYTGNTIRLESVLNGEGVYNIEHIYPRSFVKDDSILNNLVLVESEINGSKKDDYPIKEEIRKKMHGTWERLHKLGLIGDEKYKRLTRTTPFTDEEKFEFINRQLVETRQSTKALAHLLEEIYPNTKIVYVKSSLTSDFRKEFDYLKSRTVNDLHHAKDAYLNIVTGNVWYCKYSREYWRDDVKNTPKTDIVFANPVKCNSETIWNGANDKDRVIKIAQKNSVHMTRYAFCRKGGLFDQMPIPAAEGLVPLKKGRPTEIYGGYNKTSASFFILTKYKNAKKTDVMVMPVELMYADKFIKDDNFAVEYAKQTILSIIGKNVESVEFLLNKRIIKINTVLSLDGFRVCITGKLNGGKNISVSCMTAFKTSYENEKYIKHLEGFDKKRKKNGNIVFDEKYDEITAAKNIALYDCYIDKFENSLYKYRPNNPRESLCKCKDKFVQLSTEEQIGILLSIQGLFGRAIKADLESIGGKPSTGVATLSSSISNWKKNYTDVRIIDQSASGLFEKASENLLDYLKS